MLRLTLAGLVVYGTLLASAVLLLHLGVPLGLGVVLTVAAAAGATIVALVFFNRDGDLLFSAEPLETLLARGHVESNAFTATRSFQVEEWEDEGLHYFLELTDRTVLYLCGQYLYDYEPIDDDPELAQARRFPCTEFVVHRHNTEHYVIAIDCRGNVLEPEVVLPPFERSEYRHGHVPEDGDIILVPYDTLKHRRLHKNPAG